MKYPIGIQTFEKIREEGYVYVDKTRSLYNLISQGQVYFLSRPRRFGKSLFLSTLQAYFEGRKELFERLFIAEKEKDWKSYPVIHIAMSNMSLKGNSLKQALISMLDLIAYQHNISLTLDEVSTRFKELIVKISKSTKVVILIDEYDKALINFVEESDIFDENCKILKAFYGVLKDADSHIKFLFITGVGRFSKVSLFSDLNNLTDISMDKYFCDICGYTDADMQAYFKGRVAEIAQENGISFEEMSQKIRKKYNGYNFNGNKKMYNPWSVLNFMRTGELSNYWFETGTLYFLTTMAEQLQTNVEGVVVSKIELAHLNFQSKNIIPLLYQTGYLTIEEQIELDLFRLCHPNEEVSESFRWLLLSEFTKIGAGEMQYAERFVRQALLEKDAQKLQISLNPFFAKIPYQIFLKDKEAYYHSILHLLFMLLRYQLRSEVSTHAGRIDLVIENFNEIWIVECKLDQSAEIAYNQILTKNYAHQYHNTSKSIWGIGINFSSEKKQVDGVVIQLLE